ncbi:MAG: sensor histidine kinase [archaeon]
MKNTTIKLENLIFANHFFSVILMAFIFIEILYESSINPLLLPGLIFIFALVVYLLNILNSNNTKMCFSVFLYIVFYITVINVLFYIGKEEHLILIKFLYLIPIMKVALINGKKNGLIAAFLSSFSLLILEKSNMVGININIFLSIIFIWFAWVTGGIIEIDQEINENLKYEKLKTQFFANLSHELRTPLSLIFSALQIINIKKKKAFEISDIDKYLKIIKQNSNRLLRLVNNIIDLTKIESNSFEITLENVNIVSLIKEITLSTKSYVENHKRKLIFKSRINQKIIACDPFCIERIVLNLISNAVKFTETGDKITVELEEKNNEIVFKVSDTGIGIKKKDLKLIFKQFGQVDKSFSRKKEGSGIGLSLVKSLVELHEGRILVESEYGKGTTFFIILPRKTVRKDVLENNFYKNQLLNKTEIEFSDIYSESSR